jgi:hypothetical protein
VIAESLVSTDSKETLRRDIAPISETSDFTVFWQERQTNLFETGDWCGWRSEPWQIRPEAQSFESHPHSFESPPQDLICFLFGLLIRVD